MSTAAATDLSSDLLGYTLDLADDCLILSHRLGEWAGHAPEFEEDVALSNLALDLLGQARTLLTYAAEVEGLGRTEDDLAYWRDEREFHNLLLTEQPNLDFAVTITRQLLFSSFQLPLYEALAGSSDPTLAAVAAKGVKEARYHRDHASLWTLRLGDGTEESHRRMQAAIDLLWPFTGELFSGDSRTERVAAAGLGPEPTTLLPDWENHVARTLKAATLAWPTGLGAQRGGRHGLHSEHLGHLLTEMQHLHRSHPGAKW